MLTALIVALRDRAGIAICIWDTVLFSALGGTFGGALRALMMLISETGVHRGASVNAADPLLYLSRWTHYVLKPVLGLGTGILFYLTLRYAALPALTTNNLSFETETDLLAVFLFSAVGGVFFEEVMKALQKLVSVNDKRDKPIPPA